MRGGRLRDRVTVQLLAETPDELGQPIPGWSDVGTFWAGVRELQGNKLVVARQVHAEVTHEITMRMVAVKIDPNRHRLVGVSGTLVGRVFNVLAAPDLDGKDREYRLATKEIVN